MDSRYKFITVQCWDVKMKGEGEGESGSEESRCFVGAINEPDLDNKVHSGPRQ